MKISDLPAIVITRDISEKDVVERISKYVASVQTITTKNNFNSRTQATQFAEDLLIQHINAIKAGIEANKYPFVILEEDAYPTEWFSDDIPDIECDLIKLCYNDFPVRHPRVPPIVKALPRVKKLNYPGWYRNHCVYSTLAMVFKNERTAKIVLNTISQNFALPIDVAYISCMEDVNCITRNEPYFYHGPLTNISAGNTYKKVQSDAVSVGKFEIHLINSCNLACQQCSHFANMLTGKPIKRSEILEWMQPWHNRVKPKRIAILGGEPLANPELCDILRDVYRRWPDSELLLVSNGFLINKHPDLFRTLKDTKCQFDVSQHHDSPEYAKKFKPVEDTLRKWFKSGVEGHIRKSFSKWRVTFEMDSNGQYKPFEDGNERRSWEVCNSRECKQLYKGIMWKCPQITYLQELAIQEKIDPNKWHKYLQYDPLLPNASNQEIAEFFSREEEPICGMCSSEKRLFQLTSPLR